MRRLLIYKVSTSYPSSRTWREIFATTIVQMVNPSGREGVPTFYAPKLIDFLNNNISSWMTDHHIYLIVLTVKKNTGDVVEKGKKSINPIARIIYWERFLAKGNSSTGPIGWKIPNSYQHIMDAQENHIHFQQNQRARWVPFLWKGKINIIQKVELCPLGSIANTPNLKANNCIVLESSNRISLEHTKRKTLELRQ